MSVKAVNKGSCFLVKNASALCNWERGELQTIFFILRKTTVFIRRNEAEISVFYTRIANLLRVELNKKIHSYKNHISWDTQLFYVALHPNIIPLFLEHYAVTNPYPTIWYLQ